MRGLGTVALGLIGCACAAVELPEVGVAVGDRLSGFTVSAVTDLPDIRARLVRMSYDRNGADLVWLARAEENKTFAIAFRTPPEDDTGVAHILEHSVLCGSGRYPVKEPFVELLKSSMATYLNASTWPDRTVYPVATRNERDFRNLVSVYLDAVFDPVAVREDWVLRQEGWHYELSEKGGLGRSGVVFSEMKGSFANPDTVAYHGVKRLLFPDNCYGFVSGGDPAHIPELTFGKFRDFYRRHYHPSNARIFLDGEIDLKATLAQLDEYLGRYARAEVRSQIKPQVPVTRRETVRYASTEEERRTILEDGWVFSSVTDLVQPLVFDVLSEYFTGSNEAPLKKALLDAGLCEDVRMGLSALGQLALLVKVRNTTPEQAETCRRTVRETFERACREGLDRKRLAAILEKQEFERLEQDTGSYPKGLALMNEAMVSWMDGGDPADAFRYRALFASVRSRMNDRLFEESLRRFVLDNPHHAELTLVPSRTLSAERARAEESSLAEVRAGLSDEALVRFDAEAKALKARQSVPDRPEDLAKLPRLRVADVPLEERMTPCEHTSVDGVPLLRADVAAEGVVYLRLGFSLDGLTDGELQDVPFLAGLLGSLATSDHTASALRTELDGCLGSFGADASSYLRGAWLTVSVSALDRHADDILRLVPEVLLRTRYDDTKAIADLRTQRCERMQRSVRSQGDSFAMRRAVRGYSEVSRKAELLDGITQLRRLQGPCGTDLAALARRLFTRSRLTVGLSANAPEALAASVVAAFPVGEPVASAPVARTAEADSSEGFEIPAPIGFSALAGHLPEGSVRRGAHDVASRIVSLDYLWNTVRVKGGAYGTGLVVSMSGNIVFRSYRDPNPSGAREAFKAAGAALAAFVDSGASYEKYQVASVGRLSPYRSPRAEIDEAMTRHYSGIAPEDLRRRRREILQVTPDELRAVAEELTGAAEKSIHCVVGGKDILNACSLKRVEPVVRTM